MGTRYDDRYDERYEGRYGRRDEFARERERDAEGRAYARPRRERVADDYDRDLRTRDYDDERGDAYGGAGRDNYERGIGRDYDRPTEYGRGRDYGRTYGYGRDYGRAYERRGSAYGARDLETDYERGPRGYEYDDERSDWSLRRGRGRDEEGRGREGRRPKDRGWWERVSDEVASWFGDEEAERRRLRDERQRGAHFRGRGPRGYRRTDERILEDINDRLTEHPYLDASDIEVQVASGEVALNGAVSSRQAKRLAEDIAESVSGVTHVENRLRIYRGAAEADTSTTAHPATALPTGATANTPVVPEATKVSATSAGATGTTSTSTPGTGRTKTTT